MAVGAQSTDIVERLGKIVKELTPVAYDLDSSAYSKVVDKLVKDHPQISEEAIEAIGKRLNTQQAGVVEKEVIRAFEMNGASGLEKSLLNIAHAGERWGEQTARNAEIWSRAAKASGAEWAAGKVGGAVKSTWSKVKSLGMWAGIIGAVGAGAIILGSALRAKKDTSTEAIMNEPAAVANLDPGFAPMPMAQPTYQMTGSVPPVEGDWVQRTGRGGQLEGPAIPNMPDVVAASRAESVEQRRSATEATAAIGA